MPPKHKLHKTTGKLKTLPTLPPQASTSSQTFDVNSEAAQQFESELCWCIQQLQNGLKSGKLNQKQVQNNTKALNVLMSNSAPIIKKRQVMRLSFGDYRSLMAAEDAKFRSVNARIKLSQGTPSKSSVFIKKSAFQSGNDFRFKFPDPKEGDIADQVSNIDINNAAANTETIVNNENVVKKDFQFVPSGNTFMFNFNTDNVEP